MSIQYISALDMPNSGKQHIVIDIDELYLDKNNPRFASSKLIQSSDTVASQDSIIRYLVEYAKIIDLAKSIVKQQGLYDEEWIACYRDSENHIIVLEGNRRVAACKLLLSKDYEFKDIKQKYLLHTLTDKESVCKIKAVLYDDSEAAQNYIASKHTNPSIEEWSVPEQCQYYLSLFNQGYTTKDIAIRMGIENTKKVTDRIKDYKQFLSVFNLLNTNSPEKTIHIEEVNMLPIAQKFLNVLASDKSEVGLHLDFDKNTLQYMPKPFLKNLYNEILLLVGEAFLLRPVYGKKDITERNKDAHYRVTTDEIKSTKMTVSLIKNDIRIPGLWAKIQEYQKLAFHNPDPSETDTGSDTSSPKDGDSAPGNTAGPADTNGNTSSGTTDTNAGSSADGTAGTVPPASGNRGSKNQIPYFFQGLDTKKLNPNDPDAHGMLYLCKELADFSSKRLVEKYPVCTAFLIRAAIEQALTYYAKKHQRLDNHRLIHDDLLSSNNDYEKLSVIIKIYKKNLANYIPDSHVQNYFKHIFGDYVPNTANDSYTLDSLNWVVHRPSEYHLSPQELDSLAHRGLLAIINYLIS